MTQQSSRELDLVLVGATGFVGRLAAAELVDRAAPGLRVGLAGRSPERLAAVRQELGEGARTWPLLTVDTTDDGAVADLAGRTRVVASTVGPYLRYGLPLVQACAAAGTHYADLTGETIFVRRSIDSCHQRAEQTGARIVHSCGFDSVPSDLGVGLNAAAVAADGAGQLGPTVLHVRSMRGGVSGGTIDSLRQQVVEAAADPALRRLLANPYAFVAAEPERTSTHRPRRAVEKDPRTGVWRAPFVMGGYNRQVVARTEALLGGHGPAFRYREVVDTGTGPAGAAGAVAVAAGSSALLGGMAFAPTRRFLDRVLPDPGRGPGDKTLAGGRFLVEVDSETTTGARYRTAVGADRDPGYRATAVMLTEAALALVEDRLPDRGGVLTPMVAMGEELAARLRTRGFTVRTERLTD